MCCKKYNVYKSFKTYRLTSLYTVKVQRVLKDVSVMILMRQKLCLSVCIKKWRKQIVSVGKCSHGARICVSCWINVRPMY